MKSRPTSTTKNKKKTKNNKMEITRKEQGG